jgi:hypothetical protein
MTPPSSLDEEAAERRIYHAQLVTCLAVIPTAMGLASVLTATLFGGHTVLGPIPFHPLSFLVGLGVLLLFLLAWWLLGQRERTGGLLGGVLFAWMLATSLNPARRSYLEVAFALVGLVVVVRAWPVLRPVSSAPPAADA